MKTKKTFAGGGEAIRKLLYILPPNIFLNRVASLMMVENSSKAENSLLARVVFLVC